MIPVVGLVGRAGSGKSTLAAELVKLTGAQRYAMADPLKRLARGIAPCLGNDVLWGPSELRGQYQPNLVAEISHFVNRAVAGRGPDGPGRRVLADSKSSCPQFAAEGEEYRLIEWLKDYCVPAYELGLVSPSARTFCQLLGTEYGRVATLDSDYWIDQMRHAVLHIGRGILWKPQHRGFPWFEDHAASPIVVIDDVRFPNEVYAIRQVGGVVGEIVGPDGYGGAPVGVSGHASEKLDISPAMLDFRLVNVRGKAAESAEQIAQFAGLLGPVDITFDPDARL